MLVPVRQIEGVNATERQWIWGPTPLFPGSCVTSTSAHPALTWPASTATLGTMMGVGAVLYVHNPLSHPVGGNEDPGEAFGNDVRCKSWSEQSPSCLLPCTLGKRKPRPLSQKSRTQKC